MTIVCPGQAFATFYALEWASTVPELWRGPCGNRRWDKFIIEKEEFEEKFARLLFDYLTISCIGEARHAGTDKVKVIYKNIGELKVNHQLQFNAEGYRTRVEFPGARSKTFKLLPMFTAKTWLNVTQQIFLLKFWGSAYGGIKWANIARAALRYYTLPARLFIDHIADIQHNGGTAFNKEYEGLLACPNYLELKKLLNAKASEEGVKKYITKTLHYNCQYHTYNRFKSYILSAIRQTNTPEQNKNFFGKSYKETKLFVLMPDWPEPLEWGDSTLDTQRKAKVVSGYSAYTQEQFNNQIAALYDKKYKEDDDDASERASPFPHFNPTRTHRGIILPTTSIKGLNHVTEFALLRDFQIMLRVGTEGLV